MDNYTLEEITALCKEQIKILRKNDSSRCAEMQRKYDDIKGSIGSTKNLKLANLYHTLRRINREYNT